MLSILAALAFVLGSAAHGQSPPSLEGRIGGRVVTAYAGLVADALVTLTHVGPNGFQRSVTSDAEGGFVFERLPAGRYRFSASKVGYTSRQPLAGPGARPLTTPTRFETGPEVELGDGSNTADVEIVMSRSASISGRIISQDGSAAPDVRVSAALRQGAGRAELFETETWTRWDGRYEIEGLPPGEYLIGVATGWTRVSAGFASAPAVGSAPEGAGAKPADPTSVPQLSRAAGAVQWTWYPGVGDSEPGETVTLIEGVPAEGIDIWLTPAQRFSVSGRVFWPVGVEVGDITIDYGDPSGTRSGVWYLSDPGGLFTLFGIPPGPLVLLARADTDQGTLLGVASTEAAVDAVEDVNIVVDRAGTIEGRVTYQDAPPTRATSVTLAQRIFRPSALYPTPESAIDADGRFQLRDALGEYEFELQGLPPDHAVSRVLRDGMPLPANRIRVMGGETVSGIEVVVARQRP